MRNMKRIKRLTLKNLQVAEIESKEMKKIRGGACTCYCNCASDNGQHLGKSNHFMPGSIEMY